MLPLWHGKTVSTEVLHQGFCRQKASFHSARPFLHTSMNIVIIRNEHNYACSPWPDHLYTCLV